MKARLKQKEIRRLIKYLNSYEPFLRSFAVEKLRKAGSEQAIPHLIDRLNDKNSTVSRQAANALGEIRQKFLKRDEQFSPSKPAQFALMRINPKEHPKSFDQLFRQLKKGKKMPESHWELLAKELMAMERRLK